LEIKELRGKFEGAKSFGMCRSGRGVEVRILKEVTDAVGGSAENRGFRVGKLEVRRVVNDRQAGFARADRRAG